MKFRTFFKVLPNGKTKKRKLACSDIEAAEGGWYPLGKAKVETRPNNEEVKALREKIAKMEADKAKEELAKNEEPDKGEDQVNDPHAGGTELEHAFPKKKATRGVSKSTPKK